MHHRPERDGAAVRIERLRSLDRKFRDEAIIDRVHRTLQRRIRTVERVPAPDEPVAMRRSEAEAKHGIGKDPEPRLEPVARAGKTARYLAREILENAGRERGEERLAVREVIGGRGMRDTGAARHRADRDGIRAALVEKREGGIDKGFAQISMMIGGAGPPAFRY